ncbi:hypothetical protein HALDL1_11120 [Halobacterium sp. DL1]|jgi:uncharacterized membrane protein|nr:hypothetical protein HALDL1_11120 [Halobacterium sp. DL1]
MDVDAVRETEPARTHPDRVRNALLAAVVFELAVVAAGTADLAGGLDGAYVVGLVVTTLLGVFGFVAFLYYLVTL